MNKAGMVRWAAALGAVAIGLAWFADEAQAARWRRCGRWDCCTTYCSPCGTTCGRLSWCDTGCTYATICDPCGGRYTVSYGSYDQGCCSPGQGQPGMTTSQQPGMTKGQTTFGPSTSPSDAGHMSPPQSPASGNPPAASNPPAPPAAPAAPGNMPAPSEEPRR